MTGATTECTCVEDMVCGACMSGATSPAKQSAHVCPPDHAHDATANCHTAHACRCTRCTTRNTQYQFWRRHMIAAGKPLNSDIDARGTRRRLQALAALGWSSTEIARRIDRHQTLVSRWIVGDKVTRETAGLVAAVYDELSNLVPQPETFAQRVSVSKTIAHARKRGYARPIEWDDIDLDEEPYRSAAVTDADIDVVVVHLAVNGEQPTLTVDERREAVRQLNARGYYDREIARMLAVTDKTILRDRQALDIPEVDIKAREVFRPNPRALAA